MFLATQTSKSLLAEIHQKNTFGRSSRRKNQFMAQQIIQINIIVLKHLRSLKYMATGGPRAGPGPLGSWDRWGTTPRVHALLRFIG